MTEKKVSRLGLSLSVIPLLILLLTACGTSKSNSGDNNLSPAQAQEIAHAMSEGVSQSVGGGFGAFSAAANHKVIRKTEFANDSGPSCSGDNCTWQISDTFACAQGGTLSVSGFVSGSLDGYGDGSVQEQISEVPGSCAVDGIVFNGDPQLTVSGGIQMSNWNPVWPLTGTLSGGVSFRPNPSGVCQFNLNFSVNSDLTGTYSGTACGQAVSGSL